MVSCDYCGREFTSEHSLHQHRQAKHVSKKTPPEPPSEPPVPDLEGEWVELSAFRGTKSYLGSSCAQSVPTPQPGTLLMPFPTSSKGARPATRKSYHSFCGRMQSGRIGEIVSRATNSKDHTIPSGCLRRQLLKRLFMLAPCRVPPHLCDVLMKVS